MVEEVKQATDIHQAIDEDKTQRSQLRADARRTCRQGGNRRVVKVTRYQAAKCKVSNGEFLELMNAGGYSTEHFWSGHGDIPVIYRWHVVEGVGKLSF